MMTSGMQQETKLRNLELCKTAVITAVFTSNFYLEKNRI